MSDILCDGSVCPQNVYSTNIPVLVQTELRKAWQVAAHFIDECWGSPDEFVFTVTAKGQAHIPWFLSLNPGRHCSTKSQVGDGSYTILVQTQASKIDKWLPSPACNASNPVLGKHKLLQAVETLQGVGFNSADLVALQVKHQQRPEVLKM